MIRQLAPVLLMAIGAIAIRYVSGGRQRSKADAVPLAVVLGGIAGAVIGAKLPFVLLAGYPGFGSADSIVLIWFGDGRTVLWGIAGGYIGVELAKRWIGHHQSTGDQFVIPLCLSIAAGRVGCLMAGCCMGCVTDLWHASFFAGRHPIPIYESMFHLSFAALAHFGIRNRWMPTFWMPVYILAYCVFRWITEWIRVEPRWILGWTFYQWSAVGIGMAMVGVLNARLAKAATKEKAGDSRI